jgi:hypothetical protein
MKFFFGFEKKLSTLGGRGRSALFEKGVSARFFSFLNFVWEFV